MAKSEKRASTPKSRKKTRDNKSRGRSASRRKADTRKASTSRSSKSTTKTSRTSSTYSNDRVDQTTPGVPYTMMKYKPGDGKEAHSFSLANSTYPKQHGWKKFMVRIVQYGLDKVRTSRIRSSMDVRNRTCQRHSGFTR